MSEREIKSNPSEDYYNTLSPDDEAASIPSEASTKSTTTDQKKKKPSHKAKFWIWVLVLAVIFMVFFTPFRVNILLLGIDPNKQHSPQGRSDTMILTTLPPVSPYMHMLSIPRDLWVDIPGHGQNRINTAHFFAEVASPGSGPAAAAQVVEQSFHVPVNYTIRLQTEGFVNVVQAMGGITVNLPFAMSGYTAGVHHLDATQALALVRDRKGSDDFYRQMRQQIFLKSAVKQLMQPVNWWRIPGVITAFTQSVTSDVPFYLWPRLGYGVIFSSVTGFDMHSLDHNMVQGWTTNEGADVLLPKWDLINPLVNKLFR